MFAAAFIAHQRYVDEGDKYAPDDAPDKIFPGPFDPHHFQIGQENNDTHTENGGKEKYHAEKDQNTAGVIFHRFNLRSVGRRNENDEHGFLK
jgi:hypothetical protein